MIFFFGDFQILFFRSFKIFVRDSGIFHAILIHFSAYFSLYSPNANAEGAAPEDGSVQTRARRAGSDSCTFFQARLCFSRRPPKFDYFHEFYFFSRASEKKKLERLEILIFFF